MKLLATLLWAFAFSVGLSIVTGDHEFQYGGTKRYYIVSHRDCYGSKDFHDLLHECGIRKVIYKFDYMRALVVEVPEDCNIKKLRKNHLIDRIFEDPQLDPVPNMENATTPSSSSNAYGRRLQDQDPSRIMPQQTARQYGLSMIGARSPEGKPLFPYTPVERSELLVCVIDTGAYHAHPDLNTATITGSQVSDAPAWFEDLQSGHGTHVTGIIAAIDNNFGVVGVAPGTAVHVVAIPARGTIAGYFSDMQAGVDLCALEKTRANSKRLIITTSTGFNLKNTPFTDGSFIGLIAQRFGDALLTLADINLLYNEYLGTDIANIEAANQFLVAYNTVQRRWNSGDIFVAAAGNDQNKGCAGCSMLPGSVPSAISVGAVDMNRVIAPFSEQNIQVDIAAPGVHVLSTCRPGTPTCQESSPITDRNFWYVYMDGTSMATPHVSASAAIVWSMAPSWNNAQVRDALFTTAEDLGTPEKDQAYGFGLLNVCRAALSAANAFRPELIKYFECKNNRPWPVKGKP